MNRWFWRTVIAAALVVVAVWLYSVFFPSPERAIRARLAQLAKSASFGGNESPIAAMANSQRVAEFFMEDVEIRLDLPGRVAATLSGREELREKTMALRSIGGGVQVELLDINVALAPDKKSAEANLTFKGRIAGEKDLIVQELKMVLNKIEGDWRIKRVETVKTLSLRAWPENSLSSSGILWRRGPGRGGRSHTFHTRALTLYKFEGTLPTFHRTEILITHD